MRSSVTLMVCVKLYFNIKVHSKKSVSIGLYISFSPQASSYKEFHLFFFDEFTQSLCVQIENSHQKQTDVNSLNIKVRINLQMPVHDECKSSVIKREVNQESVYVPLEMKGGRTSKTNPESLKYHIPDE